VISLMRQDITGSVFQREGGRLINGLGTTP
jgi:hypothetical protein